MSRAFSYLNLALLIVLGGTCVYQWTQERAYGARIDGLQKQSDQQQNKLQVQQEDLRRTHEDLDGFKQTVTRLNTQTEEQASSIREQKAQVLELSNAKQKLDQQLAVWKAALEEHKEAIAQRDQNIKTLLDQREKVLAAQSDAASEANQAISAYNELATKYDDVVGRYNTLVTQYKAEQAAQETATK